MDYDLLKLSDKDRWRIALSSTHFNLFFNRTKKYSGVMSVLLSIHPSASKECWCVVTNIARMLKIRATGVCIPSQWKDYEHNEQKLSHQRMMVLLSKLKEQGYFDYYKGGLLNMSHDLKVMSVYVPTTKLLCLWEGVDVSKEKDVISFIKIRDRVTKELLPKQGKRLAGAAKFMARYNSALESAEITVDGALLPKQTYHRVFSDTPSKGGRFYAVTGGTQTIPSKMRSTITINGSKACELDYKALHASILYDHLSQLTGVVSDIGDPYSIDLDFVQTDPRSHSSNPQRNLVKRVLMICLNARDLASAVSCVASLWYEEYKKGVSGEFFGLVVEPEKGNTFPAKKLCLGVQAAHEMIKESFFSDMGVVLQYIDSQVMEHVLTRLLDRGIIGLPVHDSVIVPCEYDEDALEYMQEAYRMVVGSDNYCKIERKQK